MTTSGDSGLDAICPACGARNRGGAKQCFLCDANLEPKRESGPPAIEIGSAGVHETSPASFRISTLMLVIALIAVCLGLIQQAPGLGIPLAFISFLALVRTGIITSRSHDHKVDLATRHKPVTFVSSFGVFLASFGMMVLVLICVVIAAGAACYTVCAGIVATNHANESAGIVAMVPMVLVVSGGLLWGFVVLIRRLNRFRPGNPPRDNDH